MREQNRTSKSCRCFKKWCRKLVCLNKRHNLVNTAAAFFAYSQPTHKSSKGLISRPGGSVDKAPSIHKWLTRAGNLDPVTENLHHRARTCNKEILMNKCISHQFANSQSWKHRDGLAKSPSDHFTHRQETVDILNHPLKAAGITFDTFLLSEDFGTIVSSILNDPCCFALHEVKAIKTLRKEDCAQIGNVPFPSIVSVNEPVAF